VDHVSLRAAAPWAAVLALAACKEKPPPRPEAGLLAATAPVYRVQGEERRRVSAGELLFARDRLVTEGTAVVEFFNGAVVTFEGGPWEPRDAPEREALTPNLPPRALREGTVVDVPGRMSVVPVRYVDPAATPAVAKPPESNSTASHFLDFMAAGGHTFGASTELPEGPRAPLPPPPFREKLPRVHEAAAESGGLGIVVERGLAVSETADLGTRTWPAGSRGSLGRAVRLRAVTGTRLRLLLPPGVELPVEGPVDLSLRK
jgi:hypothetical protein